MAHRPMRCLLICLLFLIAAAPATGQSGTTVEVPLRARDGYLLVPVVAADGTELEFGLGTGSPPTALSQSTADRFGEDVELAVGGLSVPLGNRETRPDAHMSPGGEAIGGILGAAFLSEYEVLVDLPNGRLLLRRIGPPVDWGVELADPTSVQILHGAVISLSARMNDTEFFTLLDLTATANIVSPAVVGKLGIDPTGEATIGIGATELPGSAYEERDLEMFRRFDPNGNGFVILGAPVARDCALLISWARSHIRTCAR